MGPKGNKNILRLYWEIAKAIESDEPTPAAKEYCDELEAETEEAPRGDFIDTEGTEI